MRKEGLKMVNHGCRSNVVYMIATHPVSSPSTDYFFARMLGLGVIFTHIFVYVKVSSCFDL